MLRLYSLLTPPWFDYNYRILPGKCGLKTTTKQVIVPIRDTRHSHSSERRDLDPQRSNIRQLTPQETSSILQRLSSENAAAIVEVHFEQ